MIAQEDKVDREKSLLKREEQRRIQASRIIEELELINRWAKVGKPVIVGSVRLGLVVAPDIDLEVYSENPRIDDGFRIIAEVAELNNVVGVEFKNTMATRGKWLYWQVRYQDNSNVLWAIEIYVCGPGDPYAHWSEQFLNAMQECITDEHRIAILSIKEALNRNKQTQMIKSFNVYRAVMDDGVRSFDDFMIWNKKTELMKSYIGYPIRGILLMPFKILTLKKAKRHICSLGNPDGEEIILIEFNTNSWRANDYKIKYKSNVA